MNGESRSYDKLDNLLQGGSSEPHNVPLEYLRNITNNFSDERLLGEGGFGMVYKGVLQNRETIAVKKLNSSMPGVKDKQFENEAGHLMRLKHPNIVLLVGWCSETQYIPLEYNGKYICAEKSERLLCLEYMPKGNLRGYLSDESSGLVWDTRYKIIGGICYGLRYLHEGWKLNAPIVHMDLKPANILLDNNMVPKIADFGLSRLFSEEKTWTHTISRDGTLGYMSPEYIKKGVVSTKSDIFSLGVIILEIVTGRRDYPDDTGTPAEEFIETVLHNWSQRNGVSLEVDYQQIRRCIQIGLDCVKTDRSKRPTISEIIEALHKPESADSSDIKGVHRRQSGKRERNCGEISWMERLAKKHTPGFSIYEIFTVALHRWQKKTALRRIRVIFATVVFVVRLKRQDLLLRLCSARQRFRGRSVDTFNLLPYSEVVNMLRKKTALRRIQIIFATVVFVVLLKRRAMQRFRGRGAVTNFRPLADAYPDDIAKRFDISDKLLQNHTPAFDAFDLSSENPWPWDRENHTPAFDAFDLSSENPWPWDREN